MRTMVIMKMEDDSKYDRRWMSCEEEGELTVEFRAGQWLKDGIDPVAGTLLPVRMKVVSTGYRREVGDRRRKKK